MSLEKSASSLKGTIEKLKNLEVEKKSLMLEIEELKKMADAKTVALENEVKELMDEVKMLKDLMLGEKPSERETDKQNKMAEPKMTQLESDPNPPKDRSRYKGSFFSK